MSFQTSIKCGLGTICCRFDAKPGWSYLHEVLQQVIVVTGQLDCAGFRTTLKAVGCHIVTRIWVRCPNPRNRRRIAELLEGRRAADILLELGRFPGVCEVAAQPRYVGRLGAANAMTAA